MVIVLSKNKIHKLHSELNDYFDYVLSQNSISKNNNMEISLKKASEDDYFNALWDQVYTYSFKSYGYITIVLSVYKHDGPSLDLFVTNFNVSFVLGKVAVDNDEPYYEKYMINSGYFHVEAVQVVEDLGPNQEILGGIPYFKDAYSSSSTGTISITSSVNSSFTFGYFFVNGFSTSNGFSIEGGKNYGTSIEFGYSKTLTISDPIVNSQLSSNNRC